MDSQREFIKFMCFLENIMGSDYVNQPMYFDEEINDCLIKMYFVMMTGEGHPDNDRLYNEFLLAYHSLSEDKQEIVKRDYQNIIDTQDENYKVKRKGEMKYE